MITKLYLKNYRAFEKVSIPLGKINLFFGPNNSGKSSLISAITMFAQNLQSDYNDSEVLLSGKFEELGSYYDIINGNDETKNIEIGIGAEVNLPSRIFIRNARGRRISKLIEDRKNGYNQITIGYNKTRHEVRLLATESRLNEDNIVIKTVRNRLGRHVVEYSEGFSELKNEQLNQILSVRNLLPVLVNLRFSSDFVEQSEKIRRLRSYLGGFRRIMHDVEFIGPFRTNPQRFYQLTGESFNSVGKYGERALGILANDQKRKGKAKKNLLKEISSWMKDAEIASNVSIQSFTDRYFEVIVRNYFTNEDENLADVGYGCSQIIPILVAGFNLMGGRILIVEEPEIHLHPKAQAELGSLFKSLYKKDIQLFIETHSEHLLLRLQSHVARGDIDANDVNVFYIDPAGKGKGKEVTRIPLGKDGYFEEQWPKGFFPERLQEAERLAGLVS
jgi:predicted ATPase